MVNTAKTPFGLGSEVVVERRDLGQLVQALRAEGYATVAPAMRSGAIALDEVSSIDELPIGWTDEQTAGTYRTKRRADGTVFSYHAGPHPWKRFFSPPTAILWKAERTGSGFSIVSSSISSPRVALIGMRACDLHAVSILDRVFLEGIHSDPVYQSRRENAFIVAVNCTEAGGTCFCASMRTGPEAASGYDLALTEVTASHRDGGRHWFLVEVGTERGAEVIRGIPYAPAGPDEKNHAAQLIRRAGVQMGRSLDIGSIKELLYRNLEHPRWEEVAARCLACGNCTMVCPTCFCTTVNDVTDLTGNHAERVRMWDSCFTADFSYIHGGSIRLSTRSRYRHWMMHKLATWFDQFGTCGCVGCGRCITWCPAAIDITEEARAIREGERCR